MKVLAFIFFLVPFQGISQIPLDFGKINNADTGKCRDARFNKVCHTGNQLDIILFASYFPTDRETELHLSYNGYRWRAIRYESRLFHNSFDSFQVYPIVSYDSIFIALKRNHVFNLSEMDSIKGLRNIADDGIEYDLVFKAGDKTGGYRFSNPGVNSKYNPSVSELKWYQNIADILFQWFNSN